MYRKSFAEQHPVLLGAGILLGICFVVALWPLVLTLAIIGGLGWLGWWAFKQFNTEQQAQRRYRAELQARADYETWLWRQGDPRGTFGRYPPAA
jgi:hypothetical protein